MRGATTLMKWDLDNSGETTHPVMQKKSNGYGLYDMSGNVFEWCWDRSSGDFRVICGGSWCTFFANGCTVAFRSSYDPGDRVGIFGFRVVRSAQ